MMTSNCSCSVRTPVWIWGTMTSFIHWKTLHSWLLWYFVIECKSDLLGSLYMNYWTNNWSVTQCLLYDLINYSDSILKLFFLNPAPRFPTIRMEQTIRNQPLTNGVLLHLTFPPCLSVYKKVCAYIRQNSLCVIWLQQRKHSIKVTWAWGELHPQISATKHWAPCFSLSGLQLFNKRESTILFNEISDITHTNLIKQNTKNSVRLQDESRSGLEVMILVFKHNNDLRSRKEPKQPHRWHEKNTACGYVEMCHMPQTKILFLKVFIKCVKYMKIYLKLLRSSKNFI